MTSTNLVAKLIPILIYCISYLSPWTALVILFIGVIFLFLSYQQLSTRLFIVSLCDALLIALIALHTVTNITFGLNALFVPRFLTRAHLKEMNRSLVTQLVQLRYLKSGLTSSQQVLLQRQLSFFYGEHRFLAYFQQYFNGKVFSRFSLAAFLTNLFVQIILFNLFLRKQLNVLEMALIVAFLCFQMLCILIACQVAITWTDALYSSGPLLFEAQFHLRRPANAFHYQRHLIAKLHLMRNFELLCTKEKERFTIGPFADISISALFQFFFAYTGFFMYISMLMQDLQLY